MSLGSAGRQLNSGSLESLNPAGPDLEEFKQDIAMSNLVLRCSCPGPALNLPVVPVPLVFVSFPVLGHVDVKSGADQTQAD